MKRTLISSIVALAFAMPGYSHANLPNDIEANQWNLKDLYVDRASWDKDASQLEKQLTQLEKCSGHLGNSARQFKECLDLNNDVLKRFTRLANYASQLRDQDTGINAGQDIAQSADILGSKVDAASAFLRPELLSIGEKKINAYLAQDKSLLGYAFYLHNILRASKHTLDKKGEALIATFGLATNASGAVYSTLSSADMPWPKIKLSTGEEIVVDQAAYTKYRASSNRADRKLVFDAFWGKWKEFERTFGVTFYEQLKKDAAYAKVRNYPDSLTSALDGNNLPRAVYDTLVSQTRANLPTLHRYFQLRAKMLGVNDLHYYDIYPALVSGDYHYPIEEGVKLMLASVKPLGTEYIAAMTKATTERWMDVYPRPHKRSGAYMSGTAYDVHPYLLLNYNDDYESVSTLGHEWGHAMHSYLANKNQSFLDSDYPTFTAEIASTTNEVFLLDHMLKIAKTDDERLLYLGSALENLRGTFFRQAMFADFEREVHARVDRGESLTGEGISKIYGEILKRYHGDEEGVMKIDDTYAVEWAYIPHFYNHFYVFQYATSIAAGSMFADEILRGELGARDKYLHILKAGASAYPYDLVKNAGVDLASQTPYQAVFKRMNKIMDEIEVILAKRK